MFTNEELNTLLQMMDLATKAGGLAVAQQALPLVSKMQEMAKANEMSLAQSPPSNND